MTTGASDKHSAAVQSEQEENNDKSVEPKQMSRQAETEQECPTMATEMRQNRDNKDSA